MMKSSLYASAVPRGRPGLPIVALALLLGGCATQPKPDLAGDAGGITGEGTPGASGAPAEDYSNAPVSEVAKREAQMAPVSQKVDPLPPDPATLPDAGKRQLDIRLGSQRFNYFEDDKLVWSGLVSSGAPEYPTPKGSYRLLSKQEDKVSRSYTNFFDMPTPMPYSLQFKGPYFIHEGYLPGVPASQGCVRLRYEDARFVYQRLRIGDPIVIAD